MRIFLFTESTTNFALLLLRPMQHPTPEQKHSILTHYTSRRNDESVDSILARHDVKVSRRSVYAWLKQWDGTVASLKRASVSGRPRALSSGQVKRHVATRIRSCNRSGRPVRYSRLLPVVQTATGQQLSLRTLQRYGKEELGAKQTRGKKRTADEGTHTHTYIITNQRRTSSTN